YETTSLLDRAEEHSAFKSFLQKFLTDKNIKKAKRAQELLNNWEVCNFFYVLALLTGQDSAHIAIWIAEFGNNKQQPIAELVGNFGMIAKSIAATHWEIAESNPKIKSSPEVKKFWNDIKIQNLKKDIQYAKMQNELKTLQVKTEDERNRTNMLQNDDNGSQNKQRRTRSERAIQNYYESSNSEEN
ncbi:18210_t:CDS:2, partial [Racocetra persica]